MCALLFYDNHAKAVHRRHRGSLFSACVGRPVRCARVTADQSTPTFLADRYIQQLWQETRENRAQSTRVNMLQQ